MKKIFLIIPLMILSTTLFGKTGIEIAKELNVSPSAKVIAQWTNIFEKKNIKKYLKGQKGKRVLSMLKV